MLRVDEMKIPSSLGQIRLKELKGRCSIASEVVLADILERKTRDY